MDFVVPLSPSHTIDRSGLNSQRGLGAWHVAPPSAFLAHTAFESPSRTVAKPFRLQQQRPRLADPSAGQQMVLATSVDTFGGPFDERSAAAAVDGAAYAASCLHLRQPQLSAVSQQQGWHVDTPFPAWRRAGPDDDAAQSPAQIDDDDDSVRAESRASTPPRATSNAGLNPHTDGSAPQKRPSSERLSSPNLLLFDMRSLSIGTTTVKKRLFADDHALGTLVPGQQPPLPFGQRNGRGVAHRVKSHRPRSPTAVDDDDDTGDDDDPYGNGGAIPFDPDRRRAKRGVRREPSVVAGRSVPQPSPHFFAQQ